MTENEIATIIVDTAFHIHRDIGPGLFETGQSSGRVRFVSRKDAKNRKARKDHYSLNAPALPRRLAR